MNEMISLVYGATSACMDWLRRALGWLGHFPTCTSTEH